MDDEFFRPDGHTDFRTGIASEFQRNTIETAEIKDPILVGSIDEVGQADKSGDKFIGRTLVDILRRTDLLDHAVVHDRDPVGNCQCLFLIMRHIDRCDADFALDAFDHVAHFHAQLGIKV